MAAQSQDQDNGVRPRTGGQDSSADFPAGGVQALLGVKEPWGVNSEKLSPLPIPGCFLTSFGNSLSSNLRLEYFNPSLARMVLAVTLSRLPVFPTSTILGALFGVAAMFISRDSRAGTHTTLRKGRREGKGQFR